MLQPVLDGSHLHKCTEQKYATDEAGNPAVGKPLAQVYGAEGNRKTVSVARYQEATCTSVRSRSLYTVGGKPYYAGSHLHKCTEQKCLLRRSSLYTL